MAPTTVQTKDEVLDRLRHCGSKLQDLGVKRLGLFGSFVRDQQDSKSDIDVLVEFEPDRKSFDTFISVAFLLEDELQRRVELVTVDSLSPYIGPRILEEVEDVLVGS